MKELELTVCQGIGDIFWVYQIAAPHCSAIRFRVAQCGDNIPHIATRANAFLRQLPKVIDVRNVVVSPADYRRLAGDRFDFRQVLEAGGGFFAVNNALEEGVRLEACSPFPIQETVPLLVVPFPELTKSQPYVVLYAAEATLIPQSVQDTQLWDAQKWRRFIELTCRAGYFTHRRVHIVGAKWDDAVATMLQQELQSHGVPTVKNLGLPFPQLHWLLKGADAFLGYQSGLSILADQFDVPQLWLVFPKYPRMLYSWAKQRNIDSGMFQATTFLTSPEDVVKHLLPLVFAHSRP